MRAKKGFNLIELMVVIAIIAILASVALPMYSSFKKRTKVGMAVKVSSQATQVLQAWYDNNESFSGISLVSNQLLRGGAGGEEVGVVLGQVDGLSWSVPAITDKDVLTITWAWDAAANCTDGCVGFFCINCDPDNGGRCQTGVNFADDRFGFSKNTTACP